MWALCDSRKRERSKLGVVMNSQKSENVPSDCPDHMPYSARMSPAWGAVMISLVSYCEFTSYDCPSKGLSARADGYEFHDIRDFNRN